MHRLLLVPIAAVILVLVTGSAAFACGSLIGPNGAVELVRTSTLAAWHGGVEHYVTNFEFESDQTSFGSIIPLPAEPTNVKRDGAGPCSGWHTRSRPSDERSPAMSPRRRPRRAASTCSRRHASTRSTSRSSARRRCHGRRLGGRSRGSISPPTRPRCWSSTRTASPYFMAAKFDATATVAQGLDSGDGIPVHLTIPVDRPWVPLRILGTGMPASEQVQADVFLLTDDEPALLGGSGAGLRLERSEPASGFAPLTTSAPTEA